MARNTMFIASCAAILLVAAPGGADTLYLKDGTAIDGIVTAINDNCMSIRSGNGEILYQTDEVERIEKNDKKGVLDLAVFNPAALRHEQALAAATGLNAAQREKVIAIVDRLALEDATERNQAMKELIALRQQFDVYRFSRESRQGFGARVLPGVLEAMLAMNKSETKGIILEYLEDKTPVNRAAAIALLGKHKDIAPLEMIARGAVDADLEVRITTIHALAEIADRRVTPVLIGTLADSNLRVRNAAKAALGRIWSRPESTVEFETVDEWNTFWAESKTQVGKPVELAALRPLYIQPEGVYVITHE